MKSISGICLTALFAVMVFGDTWQETTTSDFNAAGSSADGTEVINDVVQLGASSGSAWWNPGETWPAAMNSWQYRKAVTVKNSSASPLSDYQIKVTNPVYDETGVAGSWHFEEESGAASAEDSSGNNNYGSLLGPELFTNQGRFGNALSFNGTSDYVRVSNSSSIRSIASAGSIEAWITKTTVDNTLRTIVDAANTGAQGLMLFSDDAAGKPRLQYGNGSGITTVSSSSSLTSDTWYHIIATWNSGGGKLYVNGELQNSSAVAPNINIDTSYTYLGSNGGSQRFHNGLMDEVKIYSRALSPAEIQAHYNARAKLNYGDIRFTGNSGTEFPYWMEKDGTFWVKVTGVDSIPAGLSSIYMYYGNANAQTASNGELTFEFFDDFSGDLSKWSSQSGSATIANGIVAVNPTANYGGMRSVGTFNLADGLTIEARQYYSGITNTQNAIGFSAVSGATTWYDTNSLIMRATGNDNRWESWGKTAYSGWTVGTIDSDWHNFKIAAKTGQNGQIEISSESGVRSPAWTIANDSYYLWLVKSYNAYLTSHITYTDWILVRKYASADPAVTIGSEVPNDEQYQWPRRQLITVNTTDAVSAGYSVKADVGLESMRSAGDVQNDLDDLRVVAYDRTVGQSFELDRDIIKGQGINFPGAAGDYVTISSGASISFGTTIDFTISMWIKTTNTTAEKQVFGSGPSSPGGDASINIRLINGAPRLNIGTAFIQSSTNIANGNWRHLAFVADRDANLKIYIDGALDFTANTVTTSNNASATTYYFGRTTETANNFVGQIDEVIFSNSLRYSSSFTPRHTSFAPDSNTVGLWHLDNDAGDSSGKGNNGTLNGSLYYTEGKVIVKGSSGMGREITSADSGLAGNWRMNESIASNGTTIASSAGSNNGTLTTDNGVADKATTGKLNGAVNFDGTGDYIALPDNFNFAQPVSLEFWVKSTSDTSQALFALGSSTDANIHQDIWIGDGSTGVLTNELITLSRESGGHRLGYVTTNRNELFDGNWHYIAVTYSGSTTRLYVDGQEKTLTVGQGTNDGLWGGLTGVTRTNLGGFQSTGAVSSTINGTIDESAVYSRVLSPSEIREHYNAKNEIWFKTQSATSASSTSETSGSHSYYLYYGNVSATVPPENKDNVYQFFDDFPGASTSPDATKWDLAYSNLNTEEIDANGNLHLFSTPGSWNNGLYSTANFGVNTVLEIRAKLSANADYWRFGYGGGAEFFYESYNSGRHFSTFSAGQQLTNINDVDFTAWHDFKIERNGTTNIKVYADGVLKATHTTQIPAVNLGVYFDPINNNHLYSSKVLVRVYTPNEPTLSLGVEDFPYNVSGTFTSSVRDAGGNDAGIDSVSWTATGAGTLTMQIRADNSNSGWTDSSPGWESITNGDTSIAVTGRYIQYKATFNGDGTSTEPVLTDITVTYTVPIVPPADSVSCDKLINNWYSTATFTFTNTVGFGAQIEKYYYAWDNTASYTFTLSEPVWNSSTPQFLNSSTSDGSWYFHYKPYSSTNDAGTAQDLGPFKYDGTVPAAATLSLPLNNASIEESVTDFSWDAVTDLSGVSYTLQLDNYTSFSSPVINKTNLSNPFYTLSGTGAEILIGNSTYYWRVIVIDGAGNMSYTTNPSYYKFTTASTIPQMINESTGEIYASIQDAINSVSTTDGDIISIEDTIAHTESITLSKDVILQNGILSPVTGFAVTGQGTAGGEILRNCVITSGGVSNLAMGENLTIFSPDSSVIVIENSHLVNCLIGFGATVTNSTLENCDVAATSDYFTSVLTADFRLKSTAVSAIDQGINLSAEFNTDMDGNNKGVDILNIDNFDSGAWDIGAYEFVMTSGYTEVIVNTVIDTTDYAVVYVYPSGFVFSAQYGTPVSILTQIMTISKGTLLDFEWTLQDDADWLSVSSSAGTGDSAVSVNVVVDINSLSAGIHEAVITLESDIAVNVPVEIPVSLVIYEGQGGDQGLAVLSTNPSSVSFYVAGGSSSGASKQLTLSNSGTADLNWTLSEELYWLSADTSSGSLGSAGTQAINLIVNTSGLDEGIHTGTITVTSPEALNSPVQIPVSAYIPGNSSSSLGPIQGLSTPLKPMLFTPVYGQTEVYPAPLLEWENLTNATYWLQIGKNVNFTELFVNMVLDESRYQTLGVVPGQLYYWRVKAVNSAGLSEWSDMYWFQITDNISEEDNDTPGVCFLKQLRRKK